MIFRPFLKMMIRTDTRKLALFNVPKTAENGRRVLAQLQVLYCRSPGEGVLVSS
jgi:hypothetical protein